MKSLLNSVDRCAVAHALYDAGFKPTWSSDVADNLIAGYGELDLYGDFEYSLYVINGVVQDWPYVKEQLRIEEQLDNAPIIDGGLKDIILIHGEYVSFNDEWFKIHKSSRKYSSLIEDENGTPSYEDYLYAFVGVHSEQGLQANDPDYQYKYGITTMFYHEWDAMLSNFRVSVYDAGK